MAGQHGTGRVGDQWVASQLGGLVRKPGDTGQVTLSGRCPDCGYLLGSENHQTACGTGGQ